LIEIGFTNALNQSRYPVLTDEQLKQLDPEAIFLSSEPYPFKPTHIAELKELLPNSNIQLVDGEMFSWYGSRLLKAPHYFNTLKLE
jgi:ABC-type Fe3+-hydroxamate transport system substrate-binding protein